MNPDSDPDSDPGSDPGSKRNPTRAPTGTRLVVSDCCGRLLPEWSTLRGDVHFTDQCPGCQWVIWEASAAYIVHPIPDQPEHEAHVICDDGCCPGTGFAYVRDESR